MQSFTVVINELHWIKRLFRMEKIYAIANSSPNKIKEILRDKNIINQEELVEF